MGINGQGEIAEVHNEKDIFNWTNEGETQAATPSESGNQLAQVKGPASPLPFPFSRKAIKKIQGLL